MTSGNTDTSDIGLTFDVDHIIGKWDYGFQGQVDYGKQDGWRAVTVSSWAQTLIIPSRTTSFPFARDSYEVDQFTGFVQPGVLWVAVWATVS